MNHESKQAIRVREAIDSCFADVKASPALYRNVLRKEQRDTHVRRRLSLGAVLAIVPAVLAAVAVAAGLGLFGKLGQQSFADGRLPALEDVSAAVDASVTTDDGIRIVIRQAYYDGTRVFVSYELEGALATVEMHEGASTVAEWVERYPNERYAPDAETVSDAEAEAAAWLSDGAPRWVALHDASLHDGLFLADGTYLDIVGGDAVPQADGSVLGWKECVVPPELAADELQVKAVLFRGMRTIVQDADGYKVAYSRAPETTDIPFIVQKDTTSVPLLGAAKAPRYTANAAMTLNAVDLRGDITLHCPDAWIRAWEDWDFDGGDAVSGWRLYAGDELIAARPEECEVSADSANGTLVFTVVFRHEAAVESLRLVPVYRDSGEHAGESIPLTASSE